jgi:predicted HTH domain antitoxin
MPITVQFDLPEDVFSALRSTPEAFADELRLAAAVKWFESGRISQGKAASVAGVSRRAFHDALSRYGVPAFQLSEDDLRDELSRS